jgi:D-alanine-D-alanine ligase
LANTLEHNDTIPAGLAVGITYDLRDDYLKLGMSEEDTAEFDSEETISAIDHALQDLGFRTDRIGNHGALMNRLLRGDRWDLVFNFAEGIHGIGREAQVPALLDAYRIPYTFSDTVVLGLTLHKGLTKRVVRDLKIPTPDFLIVERMKDLEQTIPPFPLFAKPLAEGTGKGITASSKINNLASLSDICRELLEKFNQPVLVESFMPGREFTVGVLGTGPDAFAVGVMEVSLTEAAEPGVYSMLNKEHWQGRCEYNLIHGKLADRCKEIALRAWNGLGCRDGGRVDLRCDAKGKPHFLEVNPLAGMRPEYSDLPILCSLAGISYSEMMLTIMTSAIKRLK